MDGNDDAREPKEASGQAQHVRRGRARRIDYAFVRAAIHSSSCSRTPIKREGQRAYAYEEESESAHVVKETRWGWMFCRVPKDDLS